ncbi:unnamed protein product [Rhizoctonia solani]|uniref:Uncharacterized protein n=1 Tax=Rhizoctonia solani TaxID=456999 RepID=A0A8H3C276_9AGAM|nr:unnamed protein product [Rhizoctonia solani]
MGCKSSKAFKEKDTTFDIDSKSPPVANTSDDHPQSSKDGKSPQTSASKPATSKTRYGGGHSDTNTYLVPGANPAMNAIYFPTPVIDPGPSYNGGCHNGGGGSAGGYSGGCGSGGGGYDSGGGGYSGGCDSGGGFSSSSF